VLASAISVAQNHPAAAPEIQSADAKPLRQIIMPVTGEWRSLGSADAPLTLIEFTDYECPLCRAFHADTFARLKKKYVDTGRVRFVSRDQPLSEYHPRAMAAAHAARCAGDQGKFWEMCDALISRGDHLADADILERARRVGLQLSPFQSCLKTRKYQAEIDRTPPRPSR
jgi:protein-disulfide isomerase